MLKGQRFKELSDQFEMLAHKLSICDNPEQRMQLIGRMRTIVAKMDELTRDQLDNPGSTAPSNAQYQIPQIALLEVRQ
jgi:hypothetical protein